MIVRRYDERNTSDRSSACAAVISNISERDRAIDVEQFEDIMKNIINETKYEGRFGKIRGEEKTVKRLMSESLLNYRFRGTTLPSKNCSLRWGRSSSTRSRHIRYPK